ncbi:PEP-CTERM sorting domain-containing protein [Roseateles depolymerans]|uniref:PEP-CTERM exosortase interaction domain protein n=1 Tax=Roseateles depolymerans TaxID=76731 RepID=A0A0U3C8Y4_9BURK|nr:PEP-CTERM sorting domain-containing protein [Roseateles depolymerans]ALV05224.1 PEP-CTERM exosortase interaction domain protein [Roseateles depolymerans]REG14760.1 putative secreted protein with PEP-CTERM sorting signal/MYXO-CTERM domain-containing protein [Roseateles depolymerans]
MRTPVNSLAWRPTITGLLMGASMALSASLAHGETILFVGNSFTFGEGSAVKYWNAGTVTDLNQEGIGGIPALFKAFTVQAGLSYDVSLETAPGQGLDYHYNNKLAVLDKAWDKVVLQSYSTLDASRPGNPAKLVQYAGLLADAFKARNSQVDVQLMATWSRADQTYLPSGAWYGKDIYQMAKDVNAGYELADATWDTVSGVIPVGLAWNRAMTQGFADTNPYDGIDPGKVKLWANDNYHASLYGSYLEALTVFGHVTGLDPRSLGANETSAAQLGLTAGQVSALQQIAYEQLAAPVPEPSTYAMLLAGVGLLVMWRRRAVKA